MTLTLYTIADWRHTVCAGLKHSFLQIVYDLESRDSVGSTSCPQWGQPACGVIGHQTRFAVIGHDEWYNRWALHIGVGVPVGALI